MSLIKKGFFVLIGVLMLHGCCEMAGNNACVADGTQTPLVNTPDYTVQKGDTLYSIAFAANMDFIEVAEINHLKPPYHLRAGQIITLKTSKMVILPKPSKLEQHQIDLLEPDFAKLSKINHLKEQQRSQAHGALAQDHTKHRKTSHKSAGNLKEKTAENTSKKAIIVKHFDKKSLQVKKNTKVHKKPADNSSRHSKRHSESQATPIRISGHVSKKPVNHWHWPTRGKVIGTFDSGRVGNKGLDIAGKLGSPVRAAATGVVVYSGSGLRGYGNLIIIKHNTRFLSAYAYNQEILVTEGAEVRAGQVIAKMGRADSGEVKLHFEIRRAGKPVDPKPYLG